MLQKWLYMLMLVVCIAGCNLTQAPPEDIATPFDDGSGVQRSANTFRILDVGDVTQTAAPNATPIIIVRPTSESGSSSSSDGRNTDRSGAIYVNQSANPPACSVQPAGNYTVNIRAQRNLSAPIVGVLNRNAWINITRFQSGWYQVSYSNEQVNEAWISDAPVTLTQPCSCFEGFCQ